MVIYAMIMFLCAALFGVFAVLIYRGNTDLIHDYHRNKVTDHAAYGKAFGKAMGIITAAMALSGLAALWGEDPVIAWIAIGILMVGMAAGLVDMWYVQKKYNGGLF